MKNRNIAPSWLRLSTFTNFATIFCLVIGWFLVTSVTGAYAQNNKIFFPDLSKEENAKINEYIPLVEKYGKESESKLGIFKNKTVSSEGSDIGVSISVSRNPENNRIRHIVVGHYKEKVYTEYILTENANKQFIIKPGDQNKIKQILSSRWQNPEDIISMGKREEERINEENAKRNAIAQRSRLWKEKQKYYNIKNNEFIRLRNEKNELVIIMGSNCIYFDRTEEFFFCDIELDYSINQAFDKFITEKHQIESEILREIEKKVLSLLGEQSSKKITCESNDREVTITRSLIMDEYHDIIIDTKSGTIRNDEEMKLINEFLKYHWKETK